MANVNNASAGVGFIPEIWANEALEILRNNIVVAPLVTKDSDIATFQLGNKLHIPYPGTMVANDKVTNTPVTKQVPTSTDTTVTLNKHKEATFLIEDFTRAQANPTLMRQYIQAQVIAIAEQVESDLIATYSAFTGSLGVSGTDISAATLRAINKKFTDNKIQRGDRHVLLSTKDTAALLADTTLAQYFAFNSAARGDISNGLIASDIFGLQLHESQLVPVIVGTPNSTKNLAFNPGAIILASRALPEAPMGTGVAQAVVTDPLSGLVLRSSMSYNADNLGVQVTLDVLYGVAKLRDEKGFTVLS
jgi:hypothetical protein